MQEDYQKHENVARPKAIIPEENTKLSEEPMDGTTMYKQYYTSKKISPVQGKYFPVKDLDLTKMFSIIAQCSLQ